MSFSKEQSYWQTPRTKCLMYTTVKERLKHFAENTPSKKACVTYDSNDINCKSSITFSELYEKACLFARGLQKLGIAKGDIVAETIPNGHLWMIVTFGIQLAGAIPLLFMFYHQDGVDVLNAIKKTERCSAIILDPGSNGSNWEICRNFIQNIKPNGIIKSQEIPSLKLAILTNTFNEDARFVTIDDILEHGKANSDKELPYIDPDDVAAILLTSGSTGTSKPVQFTHFHFMNFGEKVVNKCGLTENDIYFNPNAFNWGGGYPHVFLAKGTTRVTCTNLLSFRSLASINGFIEKAVKEEQCTRGLISVPCIHEIEKNVDKNVDWARSLKSILTGGLPIPASCSKILNVIGERFFVSYGATEIGLSASLCIEKGNDHEDYCVGTCLPGTEMKVVDENGKILPQNQVGEIYIRQDVPHLGYHNDKQKTEGVFLSTGWYKTDDVGCMRENGTFIVSGRKSDIIIVAEELISPSYLESIMQKHPGVQEVLIVAVPDENTFQQACACIIPRQGHVLSEKSMDDFFRKEYTVVPAVRGLAPKYYLFFDTFPKTTLGKTSRIQTRVLALERLHLADV